MTKNQRHASSPAGLVVVGVDGYDPSRAALMWAAAEAARRKVPLQILTVQEAFTNDLPFGAGVDEVTQITDQDSAATANSAADAAREAFPELRITVSRPEGQPSRKLIKASRSADLVVVGSHGRHKGMRVALGTTAFKTATNAACPVVVVHPDRSTKHPGGPLRVVVGVDGSKRSVRAVDFAAQSAGSGGTVKVVNAWWFRPSEGAALAGGDEDLDQKIRDRHAKVVEGIVAEASPRYPHVVFEAISREGAPAQVLDNLASDSDLLVLGRRGRGGFAGLVLGSTALKMLSVSPVPVALTPR